eukprot:6099194-Pyramimonas_sp.AAC.1
MAPQRLRRWSGWCVLSIFTTLHAPPLNPTLPRQRKFSTDSFSRFAEPCRLWLISLECPFRPACWELWIRLK